jgi:hypothetical protein
VNDISYETWQTHYLIHKFRLDTIVSARLQHLQPVTQEIRTPLAQSSQASERIHTPPFTREMSVISISSQGSESPTSKPDVVREKTSKSTDAARIQPSQRYVDVAKFIVSPRYNLISLFSDDSDYDNSNPPSRSPTPPAPPSVLAARNRFTKDDKRYFTKFVLWKLRCKPHTSRRKICVKMNKRVRL